MNNKFKVFINADIVKGNNEGEMRIRGIASDNSKDRQGEYLDPRTMDLTDFDFINWNHGGKDDPAKIIGEPDKSKVRITDNNELYVEGVLYPNIPMAKSTYNLMNALAKSPNGRRLGMSVEGMVLERDPNNPNKITKSKITGVAICPVPVNGSTWTELIQKGFTEDQEFIYDEEDLIIQNEIEKAISIESTTDSKENTGIDRKIEKESIDGVIPKKKKKKVKEVIDTDSENNELTKAEIYEKIFNYFYINDLQKAKQVFNIVTKISQMDKKNITDETINKAISILELADSQVNETVTPIDFEEVTSSEIEKSETITPDVEIEKAMKKSDMVEEKEEKEEDEDKEEDVIEKKQKPKFKDEVYKACKDEAENMVKEGKEKQDIEKALIESGYSNVLAQTVCEDITIASDKTANAGQVEAQGIQKSEIEDLMKSQVSELSEIIKSYNTSLDTKINSFESIAKSNEAKVEELSKSLNTLLEDNKTLQTRLENIEKTPVGAKSIISKSFVDRFEKSESETLTYNLASKTDRANLIQKSFDTAMINNDNELADVAINLETTGQLTPRNITKLNSIGIRVI